MKKLFVLGIVFTLIAASASAQIAGDRTHRQRVERSYNNSHLTRSEKFRIQKDRRHYKAERHRSLRDGRVSRAEKRRLHKMRSHNRREMHRLKHNGRRRAI